MTQVSVINALMQGDYDGSIRFGDLKKYGNFGLGTVDRLDGELVVLDGGYYQIKSDGRVVSVGDQETSPFAMVTFMQNTPKLLSWQEFQNELIGRALKDESFRQELLADPKAVVEKEMGKLKEGIKLPAALEIKVIEQPANALFMVLPTLPDELSDESLENVTGGFSYDCYCGK